MKKIPVLVSLLFASLLHGQDAPPEVQVGAGINEDGTGRIVVEARGELPKAPLFYASSLQTKVTIASDRIETVSQSTIRVVQGEPEALRLRWTGPGRITEVTGEALKAWSLLTDSEGNRFLELIPKPEAENPKQLAVEISSLQADLELPGRATVPTFGPIEESSAGFEETLELVYRNAVSGRADSIEGLLPVADSGDDPRKFRNDGDGRLVLSLTTDGVRLAGVEMTRSRLAGTLAEDGRSVLFELEGSARVARAGARLELLRGDIAVEALPQQDGQQIEVEIGPKNETRYYLRFSDPGEWPVRIGFAARVRKEKEWNLLDFVVASGPVAPIEIEGWDDPVEFREGGPIVEGSSGFLPAAGNCQVAWKASRKIGEGKLFFSTTARIETTVSAGLLRQLHQIDYRILQGELDSLRFSLDGNGEILGIEGPGVSGWTLEETESGRVLVAKLNRPIRDEAALVIRSQQALSALPVEASSMRITPEGAVRHSGHIRLSNEGSVRLETSELEGLTQLAPEQFPGKPSEARQVFVYRFPSASYGYSISAERIRPEVSVSEILVYRLTDSDRIIENQLELDIREAPIREWDLEFPASYSVVSVSGPAVGDYVVGSDLVVADDGTESRNLKIIFNSEVTGRQVVSLLLERSIPAEGGEWPLPRITHPEAESIRGDIGVVGAPGYRIEVASFELLVEKPLSYFPRQLPGLQQAFRIREPGWSATLTIEELSQSIQADVFHLYSLSEGTVYGSVLVNYFVTGAPVSELAVTVPADLENVIADGKDLRAYRQEEETLTVTLHQPVIGPYTLLINFERPLGREGGTIQPGRVIPLGVEGERGYLQIVSPMQVETSVNSVSENLLQLDALELPAEFQLLSSAPSLGTWQYTERPFELTVGVGWYEPGSTLGQVIEFSEVTTRISRDGEAVSDLLYFVKTRGRQALRIELPEASRLWSVSVAGKVVTARNSGSATLIPIPPGTDLKAPVEVRLRLGRPSVDGADPLLRLPVVDAPVLKTEWSLIADDRRVLVPRGGTVSPPQPVLRPSGLEWLAGNAIDSLLAIVLILGAGSWFATRAGGARLVGILLLVAGALASLVSAGISLQSTGSHAPLRISLPVVLAGEVLELSLSNTPAWLAGISWIGIILVGIGLALGVFSWIARSDSRAPQFQAAAFVLLAVGLLLQRNGAPLFFLLLALLALFLLLPRLRDAWGELREIRRKRAEEEAASEPPPEGGGGAAATTGLVLLLLGLGALSASAQGIPPQGLHPLEQISQKWTLSEKEDHLSGSATLTLSGVPGDRFLLLKPPAVLTEFNGEGLRVTRQQVEGFGLCYLLTIPAAEQPPTLDNDPFADPFALEPPKPVSRTYRATFQFELKFADPVAGIPVPTSSAAVSKIEARCDVPNREFRSDNAIRIRSETDEASTRATILLSPRPNPTVSLRPRSRNIELEETRFFVESAHLYLPSPGVIDGRHRITVRPAQGQVSSLVVRIPESLTVSSVTGPVTSWQFDAENRLLQTRLEPAQSKPFDLTVETQRGLDPLPADAELHPLTVTEAEGEVGLIAVAFGPDAQPEKIEADTLTLVNLADFDASLLPTPETVLHRVYRYGAEEGALALRTAPVAPEVRVNSKQVVSFGEERVVLSANFSTDITRAGLFQFSFPLPDGFEVESLSGDALDHWSETTVEGSRIVVMHLRGKTIGSQAFALTLTGAAPGGTTTWNVPRFELNEAQRQTGELILQPSTGIRLRTADRQNVSEVDPRTLGGNQQGALAFRLLQKDWALSLDIETLPPWITGEVLHEVTLREGQTRTVLHGNFLIENASLQSLPVRIPISRDEVIRTLRASGEAVADLVRVAEDDDLWEIRFKRRTIGRVELRIEYEDRSERENDTELLELAQFPEARQVGYFFAVRAGGRLEVEPGELPRGWQRADWATVSQPLREAGDRSAPAFAFRTLTPEEPLVLKIDRHALANALKLRVARGELVSVLSPLGDQLTSVALTMEVVQRSGLTVGLPPNGKLFSIFVNGESVHSVREGDTWQFSILPGADDRTAEVQFIYSIDGEEIRDLSLVSPQMSVPLENIEWNVVAPKGFELTDQSGQLELQRAELWQEFDRSTYLSKAKGEREAQAQKAASLLKQANDFLQEGAQDKARQAFKSVANQYALDAASNEDARVQLENLKKQQAVVGLNTRRQRLFLDNAGEQVPLPQTEQIQSGINQNRVLQAGELNYRPQEVSQLLQGNTAEDNAALQRLAGRLVDHQRGTLPAPRAIPVTLPEEGTVYQFRKTVQVSENAPLQLELKFSRIQRLGFGTSSLLALALAGFALVLAWSASRKAAEAR